ncbi:hypothetical protein STEG23_024152, partial [Scotinomys teguina]
SLCSQLTLPSCCRFPHFSTEEANARNVFCTSHEDFILVYTGENGLRFAFPIGFCYAGSLSGELTPGRVMKGTCLLIDALQATEGK